MSHDSQKTLQRRFIPGIRFSLLTCASVACFFLTPLTLTLGPGISHAQSKKEATRKPPPTRKVQTVGETERKLLMAAQEAMAEDDYATAEKELLKLKAYDKRNKYETALMQQLLGHVYSQRNDYDQALAAFEAAIATKALPVQAELNLRYNLGQLYLATERYQDAVRTLQAWLKAAQNPAPRGYVLLAHAYVLQGEYKKALPVVQTAIARSEKQEQQWLRLLLAIQMELEQWPEAAKTLEILVANFSSKNYLLQLSSIYGTLEKDRASLATLEIAYQLGYLTTNDEVVRLAELYLYNEIPYKAGTVLEKGFADEQLEQSERNWQLLADSWLSAKEYPRALDPLRRAAKLSSEGELSLRLGHVHLQNEEWQSAAQALRNAIKKGGLDQPASAQLLLGIALFQLGEARGAEAAFQKAARDETTRKSAREWLSHLERSQPDRG